MSKDYSISLDTQRTIWQPIYLKNLFGVNSSVVLNSMDDIFISKNLLYWHFFCSSSLKVNLSQSYITELLSIRPLPVVSVLILFKIRLYLVNQNCNSMTASQVRHKSQTLLYKKQYQTIRSPHRPRNCRIFFMPNCFRHISITTAYKNCHSAPGRFIRYARWRRLESLYKEVFRISR